MPSIQQLNAFIAMLAAHDWQFEFSDDHQVWKRGNAVEKELRAIARSHDFYARAHRLYFHHMHGTKSLLDGGNYNLQTKLDALRKEVAEANELVVA